MLAALPGIIPVTLSLDAIGSVLQPNLAGFLGFDGIFLQIALNLGEITAFLFFLIVIFIILRFLDSHAALAELPGKTKALTEEKK
jgi:hypothetical protein